eukprot:SAG31_NODE_1987_length_6724_cov_18.235925_9_plen_455_part_00
MRSGPRLDDPDGMDETEASLLRDSRSSTRSLRVLDPRTATFRSPRNQRQPARQPARNQPYIYCLVLASVPGPVCTVGGWVAWVAWVASTWLPVLIQVPHGDTRIASGCSMRHSDGIAVTGTPSRMPIGCHRLHASANRIAGWISSHRSSAGGGCSAQQQARPRAGTVQPMRTLALVLLVLLSLAAATCACDACDKSHWTDHRRVKSSRFSCGKGVPAGALAPGAVEGKGPCMCQGDKCDDAAACCAACQVYNDEGTFGGCDAWFMNGHDCFFKLCSAKEWKSGDCEIMWNTPSEQNVKYGSGVMNCSADWGWPVLAVVLGALGTYVAGGALLSWRQGQARGWHPHTHVWREASALAIDGLSFVLRRQQWYGGCSRAGVPLLQRGGSDEAAAGGRGTSHSKSRKKSDKKSDKKKKDRRGSSESMPPTNANAEPAAGVAAATSTSSGGGGRWIHVV